MSDHLDPAARALLHAPLDKRIEFIHQDVYLGSTAAEEALGAIEDLLAHPRVSRPPCLLVASSAGNGKTTVLNRFRENHPVVTREDGAPDLPVVILDMPVKQQDCAFWDALLTALRVAHRAKAPTNKGQAISVMRQLRCRVLLIDEVHNILQGRITEQKAMLALTKNLTNELMIPVVAAGTRDAIRTLHTDEQLADRFGVLALPRWQLDREYRALLTSFERMLPFAEPSGLAGREFAPRIYDLSRKTIGSTLNVVRTASVIALRKGQQKITLETLDAVRDTPLKGYRGEDL